MNRLSVGPFSAIWYFAFAASVGVSGCGSSTTSAGEGASGLGGDAAAYDGPSFSFDGGCGLTCNQPICPDAGTTSVSGTVYDPAGKVPLYNVIVYVPTTRLQPIATGATCDPCGQVSGKPLVAALTDASGHFVLKGVPAGVPVPLVMQLGKWRRQISIDPLSSCVDTPLTDHDRLRLPRNQMEGDMPRIALTTGGADPLECLLRKIGIDDAEFTGAGGSGRVQLYAGSGVPGQQPPLVATSAFAASLNGGAAFADAQTLWGSLSTLKTYDVVLLACEGEQNAATKPAAALKAMSDFESLGGRVFASHWHDYWFSSGPAPLPSTGSWTDLTPPPPDPSGGTLDTSFPKGQAFHDWLVNVGGLDASGKLSIKEPKHNISSVGNGAQQWITLQNPNTTPSGQTAVEYMTFNTPLDVDAGAQCGRVVYSDLHVASGDQTGRPFPMGCATTDLSPQEKALEFMLFDLSSCVQPDKEQPQLIH